MIGRVDVAPRRGSSEGPARAAVASGPLHLAGSGSFAIEVAEWASDAGWEVVALIELIDETRAGLIISGRRIVGAEQVPGDAQAVIASGGDRARHWARIARSGIAPATIVHPTAHVSPSAHLQPGCIVAPRAVIGAETRVGAHTLVSRGALIGHHAEIGAFAAVMPGANVGGNTKLGDGVTIGMGAVVVNGIAIGEQATIAAGSVVVRDVAAGVRVQGVPAREFAA